ncbi:MAG: Stealth CR1 domain-containing protein [Paludibacter sp.]|nr:Stealth CR1 domain-containing protein [Paludibacter sp.]
MTNQLTTSEIDVVIAWVDGNDPMHKKKIKPYLNPQVQKSDDIAGPTRFGSEGEIFYCVASILRFATFIRKIYIVTDEQNPNLDDFVQKNFPENKIAIEIVDHKVIFKGYENHLPVFNSRAVETCIYRIPGLSENYVYFNDDFFLIRPLKKTDWFVDDKIIAYGNWRNLILDKLLWLIKPMKNGHKPVGFKDGMIMAARKYGKKWRYFHLDHLPHPLKKTVIEDYFTKKPALFQSNISYKFRSGNQFNTHELYYLKMLKSNKAIIKPASENLLYIKPVNRGEKYLKRKLQMYENNKDLKFCCIGSLDLATKNDRNTLFNWLKGIIKIDF